MERRNGERQRRSGVKQAWTGRQGAAAAALVAAGLTGGFWAGIDAASHVDLRYRSVPALRVKGHPTMDRSQAPGVPTVEPLVVAAPAADSIWGQEVGRDERAFFDLTDEGVPEVRVHRIERDYPNRQPASDPPSPYEGNGGDAGNAPLEPLADDEPEQGHPGE